MSRQRAPRFARPGAWRSLQSRGSALAVATEVTENLLVEAGCQRLIVVKVFDGQPYNGDSAALPLQIAVAVVSVAPRAAVVRPVGLDDQDMSPAYH